MKTQDEMRSKFEKLPEIRKIMNENGIYFMNHSGWYEARDFKDFECEQYINGAWYAFQEQQKEINAIEKYIRELNNHDELIAWAIHDDLMQIIKDGEYK